MHPRLQPRPLVSNRDEDRLPSQPVAPPMPAGGGMIVELARAVSCLAVGEVLSRFMPIAMPAPIIGLLLLFGWLLRRGTLPQALGALADRMLGLFGLFFVPAGVGVVAHWAALRTDCLSIVLAVTAGTLVTIAVTAVAAALATPAARDPSHANPHGAAPWQDPDTAISSPS